MAIRRYSRAQVLALGTRYGSSDAVVKIRQSRDAGLIPFKTLVLNQGQRLDTIAGSHLGDATLWWIVAAMSDIGWAPQVPPGTIIRVPVSLTSIAKALAA
jgi:hypothetical protein